MNALDERKNKLLDKALRVQDGNCQKQKAEGEEKPAKKSKVEKIIILIRRKRYFTF